MEARRLSFVVRATYDVLPTPTNLQQWFGEDPVGHVFHASLPPAHTHRV